MKKIIDGRLYNTDTAVEIGKSEYSNPNDFNWQCETLFRKRNGEFFIFGEGGAMSSYATYLGGGSYCGGQAIIPLTEDEAKTFVEHYLDADVYISIWGAPED